MQEEVHAFDATDQPKLKELARKVHTTRKSIRIVEHGEDLAVLVPTNSPSPADIGARRTPIYADFSAIRRLTDEDVAQAQEAVRQAKALRLNLQQRHGGEPLAESWPLIRAAREQRSRHL